MAACAAVLSLIHTVWQIQNCTSYIRHHYRLHIDYLGEMGCFLHNFLKSYSHGDIRDGRDLERQIGNVAQEAEDTIENCVADLIIHGSTYDLLSHAQLLAGVEENMKSILEKVLDIPGLSELKDRLLPKLNSMSLASSSGHSAHQKLPKYSRTLDRSSRHPDQMIQLMETLTDAQPSRQVIPIVGMGGIGKTTLARSVYENPLTAYYFDVQIWITLSQEYTLRDVVLQIPMLQNELGYGEELTANELGPVLYSSLFGKRYLIVLDDLWTLQAWDALKYYFPDNKNRSRIIVTTRLSDVGIHFGSSIFTMNFLDEDQSWKLFCKTTFGEEGCPSDLEIIGKEIAKKCQGLPLSIVVIGELLKISGRKRENWESVALDINSYLNLEGDEQCRKVLALSYYHLPARLKKCFLYMGIFPQGHEIRVSQLIKLWIAEGFIERYNNYRSLEETAEDYLKDLVDRNLILVHSRRVNGKIKTCYIHDLLRDTCLRIAKEERFISKWRNHDMPEALYTAHCIVFHGKHLSQDFHDSPLRCHTLICGGGNLPQLEDTSLLHVLDYVDINSFEDIFQHVNLRYIRCRSTSVRSIPSFISLLLNLQTIICHNNSLVFAPIEIWNMRHLRHVQFNQIWLPNPPSTAAWRHDHGLGHLHTCMKIVNFNCTFDVLERIRNIKKLDIEYQEFCGESNTDAYLCLENLRYFLILESLKVSVPVQLSMEMNLWEYLTYPSSLTKLTLENVRLFWYGLATIGCLPNLQHLKLKGSMAGSTWNPIKGQFDSLKSLRIVGDTDLIFWNANDEHFPRLEILDLGGVPFLEEIPVGIGDVVTLKVIQFSRSRAITAISAMHLLMEQESLGNESIHVRVSFLNEAEEASFWAMAESGGLMSDNFIVETGKW